MKLLKELIKYNEAIELGSDPGAADLYAELEDALHDGKESLEQHARDEKSYRIGGNLHANVSGGVKLVKGFTQHGYAGHQTSWDLCLQVGNNIEGNALAEVQKLFKNAAELAADFDTNRLEKFDGRFHAYFDDGTVSCAYEYGRSYCWIAIRKSK